MNLKQMVYWLTILAVLAMAARLSVDSDTWWHLRAGQWMVENRQLIQVDQFSYTRLGVDWHYPGWLVEIPMYAIYRRFGPGGLNVWTALMIVAAFAILWGALSGGPILRAFAIILAGTASAVYWAARPYLVTFLLAAAFLWILEKHRKGDKVQLWWLPVLMVVWVNSHGGFIVGFLIWAAFLAHAVWDFLSQSGEVRANRMQRKQAVSALLITGVAIFIAVTINPSGPEMLYYPFKTVGIGALQEYIQEWQSPDFHQLNVQPFAWLLLLAFGLAGFSRKRLLVVEFLLLAGFGLLSMLAARNIALFALCAPLALTRHGAALSEEAAERYPDWWQKLSSAGSRDRPVLNLALVVLVGLAVVVKVGSIYPRELNAAAWRDSLPVEATAYIKENQPQGRLFNDYDWGAYLIWSLPEYPVFVDGRTDLYDDEIIGQWLQVVQSSPGWEEVLDGWDVNLVLLPVSRPVVSILDRHGWDLCYEDDVARLYCR